MANANECRPLQVGSRPWVRWARSSGKWATPQPNQRPGYVRTASFVCRCRETTYEGGLCCAESWWKPLLCRAGGAACGDETISPGSAQGSAVNSSAEENGDSSKTGGGESSAKQSIPKASTPSSDVLDSGRGSSIHFRESRNVFAGHLQHPSGNEGNGESRVERRVHARKTNDHCSCMRRGSWSCVRRGMMMADSTRQRRRFRGWGRVPWSLTAGRLQVRTPPMCLHRPGDTIEFVNEDDTRAQLHRRGRWASTRMSRPEAPPRSTRRRRARLLRLLLRVPPGHWKGTPLRSASSTQSPGPRRTVAGAFLCSLIAAVESKS